MLFVESLRLARLAFFKPFKLNEELSKAGRYLATNVPIWQVRSGLGSAERRVVAQAFVAVALGATVWPILGGLGALWLGNPFPRDSVLLAALASLLLGIAGLLFAGISFGVNMAGAVSLASSLAIVTGIGQNLPLIQTSQVGQVIWIVAFGLVSGPVLGLILGLAAIVTFVLRPAARWFSWICTVGGGLVLGAIFARAAGGDVNEIAMSFILAVLFALGFRVGYALGYRRLPLYLVELIWQIGLTALSFLAVRLGTSGRLIRQLYQLSPVRVDELIWFPLWTLDRQLTWLALKGDRQFALGTIIKIATSFRQGWAAEAALAAITAHDLHEGERIPDIAEAAARLNWFPSAIDLPSRALQGIVTLLNEVSQNAQAATRAWDSPGWRINLRKAQDNLNALQDRLGQANRHVATPLSPIVQRWRTTVEQALEEVPEYAGPMLIDNPYIFGNPIPPDKEEVFTGRDDLFAKIQENLAAIQKPTLVLHGQRRTGKTSLLLQLPNRLPADYVPVYIDLQATAPVDGLNRFLYTLAREAVCQADENRRIALPPVELGDFDQRGTHAFYEWIGLTRQRLDERLLLLALDEFEKIEEAIEKSRMEEAVLDVLRHLVQHHSPWLVLFFAGVRTLEEMSRNWHSYFISVRPVHVSYLGPDAARKLILLPAENHPIHYNKQAVETILQATRAQPFLVQAVCFELIQYLNSQTRRVTGPFGRVTVADARKAIQQAGRSAQLYFHDLWESSNDWERLVLAEVAHSQGEWTQVDNVGKGVGVALRTIHEALDRLRRRELIERRGHQCRFQVPMTRQWIREEISLEAVRLASRSP